jgi:hypothetical protein
MASIASGFASSNQARPPVMLWCENKVHDPFLRACNSDKNRVVFHEPLQTFVWAVLRLHSSDLAAAW